MMNQKTADSKSIDILKSPTGVLSKLEKNSAIKKFLSRKQLSALDIGCGIPQYLWILYHDFNFNMLEGVELMTEREAVKYSLPLFDITLNDSFPDATYGVYKQYFDPTPANIKSRGKHLSKEEYDKAFKLHFYTSGEKFVQDLSDDKKYDCIILSNILHLMPFRQTFFNTIKNRLTKDGLIFIRVTHPENPKAIKNRHYAFTQEELKEFLSDEFEELFFKKFLCDDSDLTESLVYLGKIISK